MVIKLMCGVLVFVAVYYAWEAIHSGYLLWLALPAVLLSVAVGLASALRVGQLRTRPKQSSLLFQALHF